MTTEPAAPPVDTAVLAGPDPNSISEIFAKDPKELTDAEVDRMIVHFREKRLLWATEETSAKTEGRRARSPGKAKAASKTPAASGDIADLEALLGIKQT